MHIVQPWKLVRIELYVILHYKTEFSPPNIGMMICNLNQFGEQRNLKTMLRAR